MNETFAALAPLGLRRNLGLSHVSHKGDACYTTAVTDEILVTGVRVVDLFSPVPVGGVLAIGGDAGAGVNVVAMEVMQNVCRRYGATAALRTSSDSPFNESNVPSWVERLKVGEWISQITPGIRAEIRIASAQGTVAMLLPFTQSDVDADAIVTLRTTVLESGRLPAVDVNECWSRILERGGDSLAARARAALLMGDKALEEYLAQPFFVAEPWTSKPGEATGREDTVRRVEQLVGQ